MFCIPGALVILALLGVSSALSPSTYLTPGDKERLKLVLEPAWSLSDLAQVLYASAGYKHLGQPIPNVQVIIGEALNFLHAKLS